MAKITSQEARAAHRVTLLANQKTALIGQATRRTDALKKRPGASVDALDAALSAAIDAINGQNSFTGLKEQKTQIVTQIKIVKQPAPLMTPAVPVQP
jgi:hypothetical protein